MAIIVFLDYKGLFLSYIKARYAKRPKMIDDTDTVCRKEINNSVFYIVKENAPKHIKKRYIHICHIVVICCNPLEGDIFKQTKDIQTLVTDTISEQKYEPSVCYMGISGYSKYMSYIDFTLDDYGLYALAKYAKKYF